MRRNEASNPGIFSGNKSLSSDDHELLDLNNFEIDNCKSIAHESSQSGLFRDFANIHYDQESLSSNLNIVNPDACKSSIAVILDASSQVGVQTDYNNYVIDSLTNIKRLKSHLESKSYLDQLSQIKMTYDELINTRFDNNKLILALDLDETLVHSEPLSPDTYYNNDYDYIIQDMNIGLYVRPYLNSFLAGLRNKFTVILFTAGTAEYADAVLSTLNLKNVFDLVLAREFCINIEGRLYIKDLSIFGLHKEILIVDNNIYSFAKHLKNGILIDSFFKDRADTELVELLDYLMGLIQDEKYNLNQELFTNDPTPPIILKNENHFYFERIYNCIEDLQA